MQLRILSRNLDLPNHTRRAIDRQVRLVIGRHAAAIVRLHVNLSSNDHPSASVVSRCRIRVDLAHGPSLTVAEDDRDPVTAAAGAAWRLERRLRQRVAAEAISVRLPASRR